MNSTTCNVEEHNSKANKNTKKIIALVSKEGDFFYVPLKDFECASNVMRVMQIYENDDPFPLPRVSTYILRKIIIWALFYKDDKCEINFWDVNLDNLPELIKAAEYMGIKALYDDCVVMAKRIKEEKTSN